MIVMAATNVPIVASIVICVAAVILVLSLLLWQARAVFYASLCIQILIVTVFAPPDGGQWSATVLLAYCAWNALVWLVYQTCYQYGESANRLGLWAIRVIVLAAPIPIAVAMSWVDLTAG
jgi:hypothetical protein